jgi:type II secretory pathway component PulK
MNNADNSNGYVTLAVLLVVGLLAAIVSSLLAVSRPALGLARIGADEATAEALLQGGVATAGFLLFGAKEEPDKVDKLKVRVGTGNFSLRVVDEGARVDLNSADPQLLAGLFRAVGGNSLSPEAFSARVLDWRDEDEDMNEDGAETSAYADAGLGYGSSNLPFHSVDEARFILGLSPRDFERLKPYLTVFTGVAMVDPLSASETVLRAIPGAGARDVQQVIRARGKGQTREDLAALVPTISQFLLTQGSGVYRVRVDAQLINGFTDSAEAVITESARGGSEIYKTVAWSKLAAGPSEE